MVAGRETCSCAECGTVCKGKFAGCVDVWARGPRAISVRVRPEAEPLRRSRAAVTNGVKPDRVNRSARFDGANLPTTIGGKEEGGRKAPVEAVLAAGPGLPVLDAKIVAAVDMLVDRVRRLETALEAVVKAPRPAAQAQAVDDRRVEAVVKAVGGIAAGLDRLTTDVKEIQALPARMEALERGAISPAPAGAKVMERLAGDLGRLSVRLDDLSAAGEKSKSDNRAWQEALKGLSSRVESLDKARSRAAAGPSAPGGISGTEVATMLRDLEVRVEQRAGQQVQQGLGKLTNRMEPLEALAARVAALEKTPPSSTSPDLTAPVEKLAARLAALESRATSPPEPPGQQNRITSMEKVLVGLVQSVERLSVRASALDDMPKRLDALETAERVMAERLRAEQAKLERVPTERQQPDGPPIDKVLASMGKRLDRLSTQVGELKGLPDRMQAIEDDPGRTETLSRGLGGAIDMIDQLSAQVAAMEHARTANR